MKNEAIDIINKSRFISLATIDEDGAPRSTIVFGRMTEDGDVSWRSSPDAVHSQNIVRNKKIAISACYEDAETRQSRAVYISTSACDDGDEKFDDVRQLLTRAYTASLGEYDEQQSIPDRLYFKETTK
jgi:hypothetical protein